MTRLPSPCTGAKGSAPGPARVEPRRYALPISTPSATEPTDPQLAEVAWDLEPLVDGDGEAGALRLLAQALELAQALRERFAGKLGEVDAVAFAELMDALAEVHDLAGRAGDYAALSFSTDTRDPDRGALLQRVQERGTEIETTLLFFELEWAALEDDRAEELLAGEGLDLCRHHLRTARRYRPHLLSEPEERILAEKQVTGRGAWGRLFAEHTSAIEVELADGGDCGSGDGGRVPLDVALSRMHSPDRDVRAATAQAVTAALAPGLRTRAFIFNTLLHDKAVDDRLRGYPHWLAARNLSNEVSDESVQALVDAVRRRFEVPRRWYRLKARMLGLTRLADYDRIAAVGDEEETVPWGQARDLVLDAFGAFSPELERVARRFFDERWIDAPPRPGKRGGAFCATTVSSHHPYVLLNYTARRRDVLTLAHELGHGLHFALAAPRGVFEQHAPLTVSETASVFGEEMVFARLLELAGTPESRLSLLASSIEDAIATIFRQIAMHAFEEAVHADRRERGELSAERFGELWAQTQEELFGDAVEVTEGYRTWWSYIPHFVNSPGYVYAYAYGQLLALSVYERYLVEGETMVPRYLEMLAAGGSRAPEQVAAIAGLDLGDPGFWDAGLDLVERRLVQAEEAARAAGRV